MNLFIYPKISIPNKASMMAILQIVLLCAVDGLLALAFIAGNEYYRMIALIAILLFVLTNNVVGDFYLYTALIPFSSFVTIQNKNILFCFLLISSLKLCSRKMRHNISLRWLICFLCIFSIEIVFDFTNCTRGSFAYLISIIIYVFFLLQFFPIENVNIIFLTKVIIYTCAFAIVIVFLKTVQSGISLSRFTEMTDLSLRFGEEARDIGGAMGIPIYCLTLISCCIILITKYKIKLAEKTVYLILIGSSVYVGFMTLSRVFFLGIGTGGLLFLFSFMWENKKWKMFITVLFMSIALFLFWKKNDVFIIQSLDLVRARGAEDFSTGRISIWMSCFQHMQENPLSIFWGNGAMHYIQVGSNTGKAFSMSAHNLYLDGVMSWGICGFGLFVFTMFWFQRRLKYNLHSFFSMVCWIPLFVWLIMQMTGGSFNYFKGYMYPLALMFIANQNTKEET